MNFKSQTCSLRSHHPPEELVDHFLPVTPVTTLGLVEAVLLEDETAVGGRKLELPEEVVLLLEVRTDGVDVVDEVIHTVDAVLTEVFLNDLVVLDGDPLTIGVLLVTLLEEEGLDGLEVGVTADNVGLDALEHVHHGLGALDEDTLVELVEPEEFQDLPGLGGELVDTGDPDDEHDLLFGLDVEVTPLLLFPPEVDGLPLLSLVEPLVLLLPHFKLVPPDLVGLPLLSDSLGLLGQVLSVPVDLLLEGLGDNGVLRSRGFTDQIP